MPRPGWLLPWRNVELAVIPHAGSRLAAVSARLS